MKKMKNKGKFIALAVFVVVGFTFVACDDMLESIMKDAAIDIFQASLDRVKIFEDEGMHVILAGTGTPAISASRSHPCTAIIANGEFLVFDAGPGALDQLQLQGYPIGRISEIFLTHMHSDHMGGLGILINLSFNNGRRNTVTVHGPDDSKNLTHSIYPPTSREYRAGQADTTGGEADTRLINALTRDDFPTGLVWDAGPDPSLAYIPGVITMVNGINMEYTPDVIIRQGNRQLPQGDPVEEWNMYMAEAAPIPDMTTTAGPNHGWGEMLEVYRTPDDATPLIVSAFLVDHYPCFPSYGFRIEYEGRVVVLSGDTESLIPYNDPPAVETSYWATYGAGADILVHEANNDRMMQIMLEAVREAYPQEEYQEHFDHAEAAMAHHTDTLDVAKAAADAGVPKLFLNHIAIPTPDVLKDYFLSGMDEFYFGEIVIGEDGMDIYLP